MQNAIDDLLRLNGCDEVAPPHLVAAAAAATAATATATAGVAGASSSSPGYESITAGFPPPIKNGEQFCNSGEMQVDLALNEAVNSIL